MNVDEVNTQLVVISSGVRSLETQLARLAYDRVDEVGAVVAADIFALGAKMYQLAEKIVLDSTPIEFEMEEEKDK